METFTSSLIDIGQFTVPGSLFEDFPINTADQLDIEYIGHDQLNSIKGSLFDSILQETSGDEWMEDMEIFSESMDSLLELQQITEVKSEPVQSRPSVIRKTSTNSLSDIIRSCGIEEIGNSNLSFYPQLDQQIGSPTSSSEASDTDQNQDLIDELEDFFIKTEGSPTSVSEEEHHNTMQLDLTSALKTNTTATNPDQILSALSAGNVFDATQVLKEEDLANAYTTSVLSDDGQNVIIIIAPPSPTITSDYESNYDTDPEWAPSPSPSPRTLKIKDTPPASKTIRKKYARKIPPQPPVGPYPVEKKERKKAQNRTAAFRYREKKKDELGDVDSELDLLSQKNIILREKLTEMETEFKYLKKLMTEAGLGQYAAAVTL